MVSSKETVNESLKETQEINEKNRKETWKHPGGIPDAILGIIFDRTRKQSRKKFPKKSRKKKKHQRAFVEEIKGRFQRRFMES